MSTNSGRIESFSSKAWRLGAASLVFFVACQITNQLFSEPVVCNHGIAFGIQLPKPLGFFLILASICMVTFLLTERLRRAEALSRTALFASSLLLGGACSNIADRLVRGCVPDFFALSYFPAFNAADIGISVGAGLLFLLLLKDTERSRTE